MPVKIITDSTADLSAQWAKEHDVTVMPLTVHFGDESYIDGVTIDKETFYQKLQSSENLPTTSQVTPHDFQEEFTKWHDAGYDVVGIFISSELSGTYQSAHFAHNALEYDNLYLIDSQHVTFGLALLVNRAVELRDAGASAKEISQEIERLKDRVMFIGFMQTLEYLRKGGRLSATSAVVGTVLGIKPIVIAKDGKITTFKKARGKQSAMKAIIQTIEEVGIDEDLPSMTLAHAQAIEDAMTFQELIASSLPQYTEIVKNPVMVQQLGSVVGTYTGPGCVGAAWFKK